MALTQSEILQVLEMFQKSGWTSMRLQSGTFKVGISKSGRLGADGAAPAAAPRATASAPPAVTATHSVPTPPASPVAAKPHVDARWVPVRAPMLGTFYAAPKPGARAFVVVGQKVAADDTVAILDVMKLMNHIKAGASGTVAAVAVADGELVEYDQPLIYIDPAS